MGLEQWELSYFPSDKDKNRWRLKLKISEDELMPLLGNLRGTVGRPFLIEDEEFGFGLYIYEAKDNEVIQLEGILRKMCPKGEVIEKSREASVDSLLDKVVKGLDKNISEKDQKKEEPTSEKVKSKDKKSKDESENSEKAADKDELEVKDLPEVKTEFHDLELNSRYTFEEFVIGPNNRFTAAASQAVADNPGKIYNPFFIYGGVGLGKTHLMHAVGYYVHNRNPKLNILYVTSEKFMGDVIDSIRKGTLYQMREHYRQVDLLLVDDIQFLVESESTQEEFFHTFNVLHQNGKQIIVTSDRSPKQLITLEDRLRSRFEWGLIADIKSPNLETRVAILKKKGENEHLKIDDNMLLFIASKLKSNIRELEGFLKRINAYASLTHNEVTMELIKSLMSDLLPVEEVEDHVSKAPADSSANVQASAVQKTQEQPAPAPDLEKIQAAENKLPEPPVASPTPATPPQAPIPKTQVQPAAESAESEYITNIPAAQEMPNEPVNAAEEGLKAVQVGFFYPEGKESELTKVKERFREVIKKHKLKFRLEGIFERGYGYKEKINYAVFVELCRENNVGIAIVVAPPQDASVSAEDFGNLLSSVMEDEKVSLQLVPWTEINKDYRYLNLALDITLLKHKM